MFWSRILTARLNWEDQLCVFRFWINAPLVTTLKERSMCLNWQRTTKEKLEKNRGRWPRKTWESRKRNIATCNSPPRPPCFSHLAITIVTIIFQIWYLSKLLRQQIFHYSEIYPKNRVIRDISDPKYSIFSISINRIGHLSNLHIYILTFASYWVKSLDEMWDFTRVNRNFTQALLVLLVTNVTSASVIYFHPFHPP